MGGQAWISGREDNLGQSIKKRRGSREGYTPLGRGEPSAEVSAKSFLKWCNLVHTSNKYFMASFNSLNKM